jgi:hypothetical protein
MSQFEILTKKDWAIVAGLFLAGLVAIIAQSIWLS